MSDVVVMLTTIDNPYNPFVEFESWYSCDMQLGYNTCSYLARIAITSSELSVEDERRIINAAINEIIAFNLSGKHIKVTKANFDKELEEGKRRLS